MVKMAPIEVEIQLSTVDPDLVALLVGDRVATEFGVDIHAPIKRTFWEWLTRKPRRWSIVHIPRAKISDA